MWAFAHGMTILELNGRFPPDADLDKAWHDGFRGLTTPHPINGLCTATLTLRFISELGMYARLSCCGIIAR